MNQVIVDTSRSAAAELTAKVKDQLKHAVDGEKLSLGVYESLRNLNEVIGTQYGDRVLYELIQNAHDAHPSGNHGKIALKLIVESADTGMLYVANGGDGFRWKNVESLRNLGTSAKEVGEGIGNKGLGFRSTEALTNDVRIYSQPHSAKSERFDGYCFRFAEVSEIENLLALYFHEETPALRQKVATTIPRYLVPLPLTEQSPDVRAYVQSGYATVVVIPLRTAEAVRLATEQVQGLANLDVPLLLFLDRIDEVRLDIALPEEKPFRRVLRRQQHQTGRVGRLEDSCELYQVDVGDRHRFLVVRREVEKSRVLDAVERSLTMAPQLWRWLDWKRTPAVSIAVSLHKDAALAGRLYNFLPMSEKATAPLMGYLDAPFFADIDRRLLTQPNLPLNKTLLETAAEACVASAIWIVEQQIDVPPHAVFDLVAWTGEHASKLDVALEDLGNTLDRAPVIPAIAVDGRNGWSSLSDISLWPSGHYAVLNARDVVRRIGARLVSLDLGAQRIQRLKQLAVRAEVDLVPGGEQLSDWAEQFAATLLARNASARSWSNYYDDLRRLFGEVKEELTALAHKRILLDRLGKLRAAGTRGADGQSKVFVRVEGTQRRRSPGGGPLPPRTLARRFHFLDEHISLAEETLSAFRKAGLLRVYDPVEALVGLKGALGQKANENRRKEALVWAFQVWRLAESRVEEALRKADLYVPTHSGWLPAGRAAFSASWTGLGSTLENYLVEAAGFSADCRNARTRLLISYANWPETSQDGKRQWIRFLGVLGVVDGLRPIPGRITRKGSPANCWNGLLRRGEAAEGLDDDWCAEARRVHFAYPYTDYEMRGYAWRLPGQIEHAQLSDAAKEALSSLIFEHLKVREKAFFQFRVGRFERAERAWDVRTLPTPLATFLRSKLWLAVNARDEIVFRRPSACWATRERRRVPPRFLNRLPEKFAADVADSTGLADLMFGEAIGLRDWQSEATAIARLSVLALAAPDLPGSDRPVFRREYQRAWLDAAGTQITFPADGCIAVTRQGRLEILQGRAAEPPEVMVAQDNRIFEARVLSTAGRAVLEVGETPVKKIVALLEASKGFVPRQLDGVGVQLLVDGAPFAPSANDPSLISMGLEWLPDVVVVSNELRGEQLERGIARSTLENRTRAIRVRRCEQVSLVVDGEEISPREETPFYAFEHEDLPTLIVTDAVAFSWRTLGGCPRINVNSLLIAG